MFLNSAIRQWSDLLSSLTLTMAADARAPEKRIKKEQNNNSSGQKYPIMRNILAAILLAYTQFNLSTRSQWVCLISADQIAS